MLIAVKGGWIAYQYIFDIIFASYRFYDDDFAASSEVMGTDPLYLMMRRFYLQYLLFFIRFVFSFKINTHGTHAATLMSHSLKDGGLSINSNASTEMQLRSRRKAAKMLVVVVIVFAVCYFPVHLISVLRWDPITFLCRFLIFRKEPQSSLVFVRFTNFLFPLIRRSR